MNFKRLPKANDHIFNLQWSKTNIPRKEEIIFGYVDNIGTSQVDITILNYSGIKGIIAFSQLSSKKVRSIRALFKEGDIKPFIVKDVIVKDIMIAVDLSFKNISDYADEIAITEKYYLLMLIMSRWFKDIYREQFYISPSLSKSENDTIDDQKILTQLQHHNHQHQYQPNAESFHDIKDLDRSISFSSIIDANKLNTDTDNLNLEQYCDIEDSSHNESPNSTQNIAKIEFSKNEWNELMELTLWSYPFSKIYEKFLLIKTKKISFIDAFPKFYTKVTNGLYFVSNRYLTIQDIKHLELSIEKFISYNINVNITVNLTCWAIKSLDKIKEIIHSINTIPDTYYESQISFESMMINSPKYEWTIKSSNRLIIDQLYQNENIDNGDQNTPDDTDDTDNTDDPSKIHNHSTTSEKKYISLKEVFDTVLKQFSDIKYDVVIQREDKT